MKNYTKILSVFPLFLAMLYFSSTAYANNFEINIEQNGNSYDLKAPIKVPKQNILQDTDDSLIY